MLISTRVYKYKLAHLIEGIATAVDIAVTTCPIWYQLIVTTVNTTFSFYHEHYFLLKFCQIYTERFVLKYEFEKKT